MVDQWYDVECLFTAICLIDTSYAHEHEMALVKDKTLRELIKYAIKQRYNGAKSIPKSELLLEQSFGDLNIHNRILDNVYSKYYGMINEDGHNVDLDELYESCKIKFYDRDKQEYMLKKLNDIKLAIMDMDMKKAYEIFEAMLFDDKRETKSNIGELMKSSILEINTFKSGIRQIDEAYGGLMKTCLMTIAGESGHMKTMISQWLCIQILIANPDFHCVYFQKEMSAPIFSRRFASYFLNIDTKDILKINNDMNIEDRIAEVRRICNEIDEGLAQDNPLSNAMKRMHIIPDTDFNNTSEMFMHIKKYRADVWCLDFATMMQPTDTGGSADISMASLIKQWNSMAQRTNSLGIILSQFNHQNINNRNMKVGNENDMEWGKQLKQISSYILINFFPWKVNQGFKNIDKNWFYLITKKNRFGEPAEFAFKAIPQFNTFEEVHGQQRQVMLNWLKDYQTNRIMT